MSARDDGGPAFPVGSPAAVWDSERVLDDGTTVKAHWAVDPALGGMTLRDYFAAMAMQGELACQREGYYWGAPDKLAANSYAVADAMLKARSA